MIVIDPGLMARVRSEAKCQWCGKQTPEGAHPHHLFGRGMGGGTRLDVRWNLIALCPDCHRESHGGHHPTRDDLTAIVAQREGLLQGDIRQMRDDLLREPGGKMKVTRCKRGR